MKIDNAIKEFLEKYNRGMMDSINELANEWGLNIKDYKITLFNINEAFDRFNEYVNKCCKYIIEESNNKNSSPYKVIYEAGMGYIDTQLFEDTENKYNEIPKFIESYISGINNTIKNINECISNLKSEDIDPQYIGMITEYTDKFIDEMNNRFHPMMEKFLNMSGYNTNEVLKGNSTKNKPVFL